MTKDRSYNVRNSHTDFVSIVVPLYNKQDYIDECLASISQQTYTQFECIIIDDGSTDNSSTIARKYLVDQRFRYIEVVNQGVSAARNLGINHCMGSYITFVDADDIIAPTLIEALYHGIRHCDADIATVRKVSFTDTLPPCFTSPSAFRSIDAITLLQCGFGFPGRLFKTSIFRSKPCLKFPEGINFEDNALSPVVATASKAICLSESCLYGYRHLEGLRQSGSEKTISDFFKAMDWMIMQNVSRPCAVYTYYFSLHNCILHAIELKSDRFWEVFLMSKKSNISSNAFSKITKYSDNSLFQKGMKKYFFLLLLSYRFPILLKTLYKAKNIIYKKAVLRR